jgi:DNA-binding NtrC family response regulator
MMYGTDSSPAGEGRHPLLLVDDDPLIAEPLGFVLGKDFRVVTAPSRAAVSDLYPKATELPDLALVDLGLPPTPHSPEQGFALIQDLLARRPGMKVLVLSGQNEMDNVRHALSLGAADFIPKPCDPALLRARLQHQLMILEAERPRTAPDAAKGQLLGESAVMHALVEQIGHYAETPFPVLIQGESGSGKELVAEMLHRSSPRQAAPYVAVNCAAFTADLLEAQLFGHAKGAFTGAVSARGGFFEEAGEGTLLLDEVGEFPLELQPKLLRVIENGEYFRIGETRPRICAARIVAATNRDLPLEVREGRFRQDLFHRLGVLTLEVPPLRERGRDRLLLLRHFLRMYESKVRPFTLDEDATRRWLEYGFPGNVRELRNLVIRLAARYPGREVGLTELEPELDSGAVQVDSETLDALRAGSFRLDEILSRWEQRYIDAALKLSRGNLSEAARLLGVNRTTLHSKVQRLSKERETDV